MSAPKHTPGPWEAGEPSTCGNAHEIAVRSPPLGVVVCSLTWIDSAISADTEAEAATRADAFLIAAAPDLLAACVAALDRLGDLPTTRVDTDLAVRLHNAIAKARGE